jgi:hypothetical protein
VRADGRGSLTRTRTALRAAAAEPGVRTEEVFCPSKRQEGRFFLAANMVYHACSRRHFVGLPALQGAAVMPIVWLCVGWPAAVSGCGDAKGRAISGWRHRGSFDNPRTCDPHRCRIACNFDGDPAASHPEVAWCSCEQGPSTHSLSLARGGVDRELEDPPTFRPVFLLSNMINQSIRYT